MNRKGLETWSSLADASGMSRQSLGAFLGKDGGSIRTLRRIAAALGTSAGKILVEADRIRNSDGTK